MVFGWFGRGRRNKRGVTKPVAAYRPRIEPLEDREVPAALFLATGADIGGGPQVNVYGNNGQLITAFYAYNPANYTGGVRVAVGDVTGDTIPDIITAPGPGGFSDIRVFDGRFLQTANWRGGDLVRQFNAFGSAWNSGCFVAVGYINLDQFADIAVGRDAGGAPQVKVFSGFNLSVIGNFFPYPTSFAGGVRVAVGDVNRDGFADLITGAGPGGGPQVNVYSGFNGALLSAFYGVSKTFTGGIYVGSGDYNGDGFADIIVGAGAGSVGGFVQVFSGFNRAVLFSVNAFPGFAGGARVAAADFNGDGKADIIIGAGPGGGPQVSVYNGGSGTLNSAFLAYSGQWAGGVFVGGG